MSPRFWNEQNILGDCIANERWRHLPYQPKKKHMFENWVDRCRDMDGNGWWVIAWHIISGAKPLNTTQNKTKLLRSVIEDIKTENFGTHGIWVGRYLLCLVLLLLLSLFENFCQWYYEHICMDVIVRVILIHIIWTLCSAIHTFIQTYKVIHAWSERQ